MISAASSIRAWRLGQVHGGVAQGIGQSLLEHVVFDPEGQLLSGSLMDYTLPRAQDLPNFAGGLNDSAPTASNPLGVKGTGQAGCHRRAANHHERRP